MMRLLQICFFVFAAVLFLVPSVQALTVTETGVDFTVAYIEPSVNSNGSPITDLKRTYITVTYPDGTVTMVKSVDAVSPSGGASISEIISIVSSVDEEFDIVFNVYAEDITGNTSAPSAVTKRVDRLPPGPVQ